MGPRARRGAGGFDPARAADDRKRQSEGKPMTIQATNLPRVTYSNTGEDFSGVHAHLDEVIPAVEARLFGQRQPALISGRDRSKGEVVAARSPIDRDIILGEFPLADAAVVDEAVAAARGAYPPWRDLGWPRRVEILRAGADVLEERKWDVSVACLVEVGKSRLESVCQVGVTACLMCYYFTEMVRTYGFTLELHGASAAALFSVRQQ